MERSWSLRVTTLVEAEAAAAPFIADHKDLVAFSKACNDPINHWANIRKAWLMEPGSMVVLEDGTEIVADQHSIITITPDKKPSSKPNRQLPVVEYTDYGRTTPEVKAAHAARCALEKVRDIDAEVIEAYITDRRKRGKFQADDDPNALRRTLADFKAINGGKTISQSTRKDVDALIEYLLNDRDPQLSPKRVRKLLSYVRAAVNVDIQHNQAAPNFRYNIFDNFFVPGEEENRRPPYSKDEIAAIKANLSRFTDEQTLMLVWHISSSVRPCGIYSIVSDEWEDGEHPDSCENYRTRHIRIRRDKGEYGPRNLPIPQAVLDLKKKDGTSLLPDPIVGPLFSTPLPTLLVENNNKLERLGIHTEENRKTLYSGRHRAKDRLVVCDCPEKISKAIMGHTRDIEQHDRYGTGAPMWKLKPWIDKIGF
jgi:hypothetical protein